MVARAAQFSNSSLSFAHNAATLDRIPMVPPFVRQPQAALAKTAEIAGARRAYSPDRSFPRIEFHFTHRQRECLYAGDAPLPAALTLRVAGQGISAVKLWEGPWLHSAWFWRKKRRGSKRFAERSELKIARFDELFEYARRNIQAAVLAASPEPMESLLLLMLVEALRKIQSLERESLNSKLKNAL
jgi:hypothetical protein